MKGDDVEVASPSELIGEATRIDNSYHVVTTGKIDNTAILDGFIITAGNAGNHSGAGIHNTAGSPTIGNCVITGNLAQCGAGICSSKDSNPTLTNCIFAGNASKCCGGAIRNGDSNPVIKNCTFSDNHANLGGAIRNHHSNPTLTGCAFRANSSLRNGGAVYNHYSEPKFINCTFSGNSTDGYGGAVQNCTSDAKFTNCIFVANACSKNGGAMFNCPHGCDIVLVNCTFTANYAKYHGGGICSEKKSNPKLTNCILWANIDRDGTEESSQLYGGVHTTVNYCCIQGWTGKRDGLGNINADPLFSRNPDDGGDGFGDNPQTSDIDESSNDAFGQLQLLPDSPCIDTGEPGYTNEDNEKDIEGKLRLTGERIDIGAYEYSR